MLIPTLFYFGGTSDEYNILRTSREFLCFAVIYYFLSNKYINNKVPYYNSTLTALLSTIIIAQLGLAVIQFMKLRSGIGVYLPVEWYIQNMGTIPDELDLKWSKIRPSGTYGEPSYLGFISLSLLLVVVHLDIHRNLKLFLITSIATTVLLANTLAGILSITVLLFLYVWKTYKTKISIRLIIVCFVAIFIGIDLLTNFSGVTHRLGNMTDRSVELSGYYRIIVPLKVLAVIITESPIGIPTADMAELLFKISNDRGLTSYLSNGFFNLFINYGVFALIIMFFIYKEARKNIYILIYLFLTSMFNGSIFSFDKAVVISVVLVLVNTNVKSMKLASVNKI
jgi:hypothetical protein